MTSQFFYRKVEQYLSIGDLITKASHKYTGWSQRQTEQQTNKQTDKQINMQ